MDLTVGTRTEDDNSHAIESRITRESARNGKRLLGRTGHKSSILAFGGAVFIGKLRQTEVDAFMKRVLERGANHIDVAQTYGDSELGFGKRLKECWGNPFLACRQ